MSNESQRVHMHICPDCLEQWRCYQRIVEEEEAYFIPCRPEDCDRPVISLCGRCYFLKNQLTILGGAGLRNQQEEP